MCLVYKISFKDCDEFYIGSTVNLMNRKIKHKYSCYNSKVKKYNYKLYQFIREHYEWKDVIFEILEEYETVLDKLELRKLEQKYINELKPTLNHRKAYQSKEERKEQIIKSTKKYREKKETQERIKKYREENREKIKEQKKIYREENKEELKEKKRIYREENKAKLNEKIKCECGGKYIHNCRARHLKSTKHQDYLANSNK